MRNPEPASKLVPTSALALLFRIYLKLRQNFEFSFSSGSSLIKVSYLAPATIRILNLATALAPTQPKF